MIGIIHLPCRAVSSSTLVLAHLRTRLFVTSALAYDRNSYTASNAALVISRVPRVRSSGWVIRGWLYPAPPPVLVLAIHHMS